MKLRKYLWDNELCMSTFAKQIGYSRTYMAQVMNGKIRPGKRCARDIEIGTGGFITAQELLDGSFLKKEQ